MKYNDRKDIPEEYKWDLTQLVSSDEEWERLLAEFSEKKKEIVKFKGKLKDKATLLECFAFSDELELEFETIYVYANMKNHEDMRIGKYQQYVASLGNVVGEYMALSAFITPEIIASYSVEELNALSDDPAFNAHSYELKELARKKDTILSEKEESILGQASAIVSVFHDTFARFDNADVKFAPVKVGGKKVKLSHGVYGTLMQNKNREVRKAAHFSMFNGYKDMINTLASNYSGNVQADWMDARIRGFKSSLSRALDSTNVPVEVYNTLIEETHKALPSLKKYLTYRKKQLGVSEHKAYDMYANTEKYKAEEISFDDAFNIVLEGLAPMGEDYVELLKKARRERWLDVYESDGKRSGGYSWGVYGHPAYILLNFNGTLSETFTIAHELGHSMHSYFSDNALPYAAAQYKIFVAEIASTVNETLLINHLLKTATGERRKYLLSYRLDMFKATVFRQTMFAEFEQKAHEYVEKGGGLSAEALCDMYEKLNVLYYGKQFITPVLKYEWARIPHFYTSFYVYQYATGLISATAIASDILSGKEGAVENYKKFLSAGGSMPPLEILKLAGVDLTTPEPFKKAFALFADTLKELSSLK
ncbi:MAG: oligoendopeptidase F [Clostridia bacterium]|nr:oligoendopeptidase F [Clostridia bacterium]